MFAVSKLVTTVIQGQQESTPSFWPAYTYNKAYAVPRISTLKKDYIKLMEGQLLKNNSPKQTEFILGIYTQLNNIKSINIQQQF